MDSFNLFLVIKIFFDLFFVWLVIAPAGNEPNTSECEGTSTDKLANIFSRGSLEISVKDCTAKYDRKGEENKLCRNNLSGIEALQCSIKISDLHDCSKDEDKNK